MDCRRAVLSSRRVVDLDRNHGTIRRIRTQLGPSFGQPSFRHSVRCTFYVSNALYDGATIFTPARRGVLKNAFCSSRVRICLPVLRTQLRTSFGLNDCGQASLGRTPLLAAEYRRDGRRPCVLRPHRPPSCAPGAAEVRRDAQWRSASSTPSS